MGCMPFDTLEFYKTSCEHGFVKLQDVAKNICWETQTEWGPVEITINLSKPEKDPRAIAADARRAAAGEASYVDPATGFLRACPLCVTEADVACDYARPIELGGEPWALWFSPYAYYSEHCIAMTWEHRPMHIDRSAFECLFDAVELFPEYFFGSNADLPLVGGSILGHDHFQGGGHVFAMQKAPLYKDVALRSFEDVQAGVVKWPMSIIRLQGRNRSRLVDAACAVLDAWCVYDDPSVGIYSGVNETAAAHGRASEATLAKVHNTITPILRKDGAVYQLDLALRCNIADEGHPLGVFHAHEGLHHIKKENIGLIEVMGLAILPPRVRSTMEERGLSRDDVGSLFMQVLECAGVFKWDDAGRVALDRFLARLAQ